MSRCPTRSASGCAPGADGEGATFDEIEAELAELCGQRNAIDGRIAELLAAVADEDLIAGTGLKSVEHFATWQLGCSRGRARELTAIAERLDDLPVTTGLLRDGLLSADQVAVIARKAPAGTDEAYAELAQRATVSQLKRALRTERTRIQPDEPAPPPPPEPERQVSIWWDDDAWNAHLPLPKVDGAVADAALRSHVDVESRAAGLHLGPALSDAERRYLCCDAKIETWFERDGIPMGAARTTREVPRRLRRALEHRDRGCRVPACDATVGLHAHHLIHRRTPAPPSCGTSPSSAPSTTGPALPAPHGRAVPRALVPAPQPPLRESSRVSQPTTAPRRPR